MESQLRALFAESSESQINDYFDQDVRTIMGMRTPCATLMKLKSLKEAGNKFVKTKAYWLAISVCVFIPKNEHDANMMENLGIVINLNIVACWLKLNEFELAKP